MESKKYIFFKSFISAYRSNKPYLIVARSSIAYQFLPLFRVYGLISYWGFLDGWLGRNVATGVKPEHLNQYIIIWFNVSVHTNTLGSNDETFFFQNGGLQPKPQTSIKFKGPKVNIKLLWKPSMGNKSYISIEKLRKNHPRYNVVLFLETKRGLISSEQALKYGIGGLPIFAIYFLSNFF